MSEIPGKDKLENFYNKSQEYKKSSLKALDEYLSDSGYQKWDKVIKKSKIQKDFKNKEVNYRTVNESLDGITTVGIYGEVLKLNDIIFGNLKFENKDEICSDIKKMGPFTTNEDLIEKIAKYIKSNMKFPFINYYSWGNTGDEINKEGLINGKNTNCDLIIDKIKEKGLLRGAKFVEIDLKNLKSKLIYDTNNNNANGFIDIINIFRSSKKYNQLGINFSGLQSKMSDINSELAKLKSNYGLNSKYTKDMQEFINMVNKKDSQGLKNNFYDFYNLFAKIGKLDIIRQSGNVDGYDVSDYIKSSKTGVCRHFASIAKFIFEEMRGEVLDKTLMTEFYYVGNLKNSHAYNLLKTENSDGEIKEKYLDITSFMQGHELWKDVVDGEIYGQKQNEVITKIKQNKKYKQEEYLS